MPLHPPPQLQLGLSNNWNCHLAAFGPSHCHLGNSYATIPASLTGGCTHSATAPSTLNSDSYRSRSINSLPQYFSFSSTSFICTSDVLLTWVSEGPSRAFLTLVLLRYPKRHPGSGRSSSAKHLDFTFIVFSGWLWYKRNFYLCCFMCFRKSYSDMTSIFFWMFCVVLPQPSWIWYSFLYYFLKWTCWLQAGSYWK